MRDPVRPRDRESALLEHKNLKMAASAHAYVRGATARFYEWLGEKGASAIPEGPAIWICGDCHTGNMGPIADDKGRVHVQIRDFDQAVVGNPSYDLIRLGLSLATAARGSDLPGIITARMIEALMEGYEAAFPEVEDDEPQVPDTVRTVLKKAIRRDWKALARDRIENIEPSIPLGTRFWPLASGEKKALRQLFSTPALGELATQIRGRGDAGKVSVVDAAYWRKGCSSLGLLRYAVLLDVDGGTVEGEDLCLIDIKEAAAAVTPRVPGTGTPRDNALRVVQAAQHLSPALGNRMRPGVLLDKPVFVRELLPQDLKVDVEHFGRKEATRTARFLATVVGRAHSRQMDAATRAAWRKELSRNHTRNLAAPSWLWSSVIRLVAEHERAYLEHCRKYVLERDGEK
ncbi:uncharacterized protein (DUF2252 family) [Luteibacter sp. Sphag1AF]|nr:DUF2252 family protein [Luteibacter sp. Sphag1AF]MBB3225999.1 uncharacterized protein (DUF2252 family) [Luteibacter sp. Sphag1AF]